MSNQREQNPWLGKTIIVVDDSPAILNKQKDIYFKLGLKVIGEAKNGMEALNLVARTNPDFVSLDIIMPQMNGIECLQILQHNYSATNVVMVSYLFHEVKFVEYFQKNFPGIKYLKKPLDSAELYKTFQQFFTKTPVLQDNSVPLSAAKAA